MRNKILKYVVVVFFAGLIVVEGVYAFLSYNLEQKEKIDISVNAASAIVMEADTGRVLYAKNADRKRQPASTVKVMTAITAIENSDLDQDVIPTRVVNMVEPTVAGLKPGVKYKMKDMLTAILIKSANDAAIAIAEGVAGN
ncbi:MAG TPA: D-alanyl-D-alanine carboxypeptidase, partial [Candidatus Omnitrophota bacterium]|nr:D-alanyl-D-alanine carboxypeptidase [Candidatus Omnitrophota bacterium]